MAVRSRRDGRFKARARSLALSLCLLAVSGLPVARAAEQDRQGCLTLSFAPLDDTLPACDRLIDAGDLADEELYEALMARARASEFAMTYHFGHQIEPEALLKSQRTDLDRAVEIARRLPPAAPSRMLLRGALSERASVSIAMGHHNRAVEDYSKSIGLSETPNVLDFFGRSVAFERLGRLGPAIQDMTAIIAMSVGDGSLANRLVRRAELYEAAGNSEAAIADYRRAIASRPDHTGARNALERLKTDP